MHSENPALRVAVVGSLLAGAAMTELRALVIVPGDQLDLEAAALDGFDAASDMVWMAEVAEESTQVRSSQPLRLQPFDVGTQLRREAAAVAGDIEHMSPHCRDFLMRHAPLPGRNPRMALQAKNRPRVSEAQKQVVVEHPQAIRRGEAGTAAQG
jgi:deoxyribodipyrimidine photolyase-like uncharacterized protein